LPEPMMLMVVMSCAPSWCLNWLVARVLSGVGEAPLR
jgi:hypothetical protein